eukprot:1188303-Prorocentrum_minimum.AAC.1
MIDEAEVIQLLIWAVDVRPAGARYGWGSRLRPELQLINGRCCKRATAPRPQTPLSSPVEPPASPTLLCVYYFAVPASDRRTVSHGRPAHRHFAGRFTFRPTDALPVVPPRDRPPAYGRVGRQTLRVPASLKALAALKAATRGTAAIARPPPRPGRAPLSAPPPGHLSGRETSPLRSCVLSAGTSLSLTTKVGLVRSVRRLASEGLRVVLFARTKAKGRLLSCLFLRSGEDLLPSEALLEEVALLGVGVQERRLQQLDHAGGHGRLAPPLGGGAVRPHGGGQQRRDLHEARGECRAPRLRRALGGGRHAGARLVLAQPQRRPALHQRAEQVGRAVRHLRTIRGSKRGSGGGQEGVRRGPGGGQEGAEGGRMTSRAGQQDEPRSNGFAVRVIDVLATASCVLILILFVSSRVRRTGVCGTGVPGRVRPGASYSRANHPHSVPPLQRATGVARPSRRSSLDHFITRSLVTSNSQRGTPARTLASHSLDTLAKPW